MIIRAFKDADLEKMLRVVKAAKIKQLKDEGVSESETKEILSKLAEHTQTKLTGNPFFVAETEDDQIVGIIGIRPDDGSDLPDRLSTFFIQPEFQGQGIGRKLYDQALETALKLGIKKLKVSSSTFAEPIYTHFGFKKIREIWKDYPSGTRNCQIWMEKDLP